MPNITAMFVFKMAYACLSASAKDTGSAANERARTRNDGVYTWIQATLFMISCGSPIKVKVECLWSGWVPMSHLGVADW